MIKLRRFSEAIERKNIEKYEKDASNLSKNVRRIQTLKDFKLVKESFTDWALDFDDFVFKSLFKKNSPNPSENEARRAVQEYTLFITNYLFRPIVAGEAYMLSQRFGVDYRDADDMNKYPLEGQEIFLEKWKENINSLYQKYNKLRKNAFEKLYEYFDTTYASGVAPDFYKSMVDKIQGVDISWRYDETKDLSTLKDKIQMSKIAIEDALIILKKSKFAHLLHNVVIEVEMDYHFDYGGRWEGLRANKILLVAPIGKKEISITTRSLIHEFGHKYWDLLDNERKSFFSKSYGEKKVRIEKRHVEILFDAYKKAIEKKKPSRMRFVGDVFKEGLLFDFISDLETQFVYEMMIYNETLDMIDFFFSYEDGVAILENKEYGILYKKFREIEGIELGINAVTGYARSRGATEGFPELFSYVLMGYDVPIIARKLFYTITGVYK